MKCRVHPDQPTVSSCSVCHEEVCSDCLIIGRIVRCLRCAQNRLDRADGLAPSAVVPSPAETSAGRPAAEKKGAGPILVLFAAVIALGLAAPVAPYLLDIAVPGPQRVLSGFIAALAQADYERAAQLSVETADAPLDPATLRQSLRLDGSEAIRVRLLDLSLVEGHEPPIAVAEVEFRGASGPRVHAFHLVRSGSSWLVLAVDPCRPARCGTPTSSSWF